MANMKPLLTILVLVLAAGLASAEDWPEWRGPDRTGAAALSPPLLDAWPAGGPKILWKADLAPGHGSPVVAGGKVYITTGDNELLCFDAAGDKPLWKAGVTEGTGGSFSTPCVVGGRVYVVLNGRPCCYDAATGAKVWMGVGLGKDVNASPLVVEGVAVFGGQNTLRGFDATSGKQLWDQPKAGADNTINASPVLWRHGGKAYAIVNANGAQICVDIKSGNVMWRTERGGGFQTPAVSGDIEVVGTAGAGGEWITGYQLSAEGAAKIWEVKLANQESSPTIVGPYVYAISGEEMICLTRDSGQVRWRTPMKTRVSSSLAADGKLFILTDDGRSIVCLKAAPEKFTPLGGQVLEAYIGTTPAIADGRMYVRLKKSLVCYDLRKQ
jgi:outer membrane protein assembly factor BamB